MKVLKHESRMSGLTLVVIATLGLLSLALSGCSMKRRAIKQNGESS